MLITFFVAIITIGILALGAGTLLNFVIHHFQVDTDPIVKCIDNLLPQSQCAQCGYPGCRSYAESIARGEPFNKCIPGGEALMLKIAEQLNAKPQPIIKDIAKLYIDEHVAYIDETNCIGCTKCIQICPIDAIVGTMHAVHTIISSLCTGCDLCVPHCPTNCITIRTFTTDA